MQNLIQEFIEQRPVALVGASNDKSKFGNIIYHNLRTRGWSVYGINPKTDSIDGEPAYHTLAECPIKPELVVLVVPPAIGLKALEEIHAAGIERVWLQPGAASPELLARAVELKLRVVHDACIMVLADRAGM